MRWYEASFFLLNKVFLLEVLRPTLASLFEMAVSEKVQDLMEQLQAQIALEIKDALAAQIAKEKAEVSYARLQIVREEFGTVLRDRRWTFALLLCKVLRLYLFVKCFETLRACRRVVAFSSTLLALHFRKLLRPYAIAGGS